MALLTQPGGAKNLMPQSRNLSLPPPKTLILNCLSPVADKCQFSYTGTQDSLNSLREYVGILYMDLTEVIATLRQRLELVNATIAILKSATASSAKKDNRGRKSMGPLERLAVSERMRRYWQVRRAESLGEPAPSLDRREILTMTAGNDATL